MEKLREALVTFANSNPSLFPNDDTNFYPTLIHQRFSQFRLDLQTPNHPPYAFMIHRALGELNEKGGSSEESISKYIKKEYADLPWAHSTLLKHHLEKLCDRNEIYMTQKQCYLLSGVDSDPISTSKPETVLKRKQHSESGKKNSGHCKDKQESGQDSEPGKTNSRNHKKLKKKEKSKLGIQETNKQMIEVIQEQDQIEILDEVADDKEQTGIDGTKKKELKRNRKSKQKSSKGMKKHKRNEENHMSKANVNQHVKVTENEPDEQKQILDVNMNDVQVEEKNELYKDDEMAQESQPDNSGYVNLEKIQMKQNPQLLKPEESPCSNHILHKNGRRVWTRSQLNTKSKKDALTTDLTKSAGHRIMQKDKLHIVENLLSEEEQQQAMEIIEEKQGPIAAPTQRKRQQAKGGSSKEAEDPEKSEDQPQEDTSKHKRRGRHPKPREPEQNELLCSLKSEAIAKKRRQSAKKCKVGSRCPKPKRVGKAVPGKSKSSNKKDRPKYKCQGSHKITKKASKKRKVSSR